LGRKSAAITAGTDKWDLLSALRISLFTSSMEDVSFVFPHQSCTQLSFLSSRR
jgi:hypothetical protein